MTLKTPFLARLSSRMRIWRENSTATGEGAATAMTAIKEENERLREAAWLGLEELTQWQGMDPDDEGTEEAIQQLRDVLGANE